MNNRYPDHNRCPDDIALDHILKRNDPITPPTHAFLAALETDIFSQIDNVAQTHTLPSWSETHMPNWMIDQGLSVRVLSLMAVLVIMSGFIVGQISYGEPEAPTLVGVPSLFALADEPSLISVPPSDASQGDSNEAQ